MSWFKKKKDQAAETKTNETKEHWWSAWKKHPNKKPQEEIKVVEEVDNKISVDDYHIVDKHTNDSYILSDEEELNLKEQKTKLLNMMIENPSDNNADILGSTKTNNGFNQDVVKRVIKPIEHKTEPVQVIDIKEPFNNVNDNQQESIISKDKVNINLKDNIKLNQSDLETNESTKLTKQKSLDEILNQADLLQDKIQKINKTQAKINEQTTKNESLTKSINNDVNDKKQVDNQSKLTDEDLINQRKLLIQKQKELRKKEREINQQINEVSIDLSIFDNPKNLVYLEPIMVEKRQFRIYKAERRKFKYPLN